MSTATRVFVGLGSNLGDRQAHLDAAIGALDHHPRVRVVAESSRRLTPPLGGPPQPDFLNSVVELETELEPRELMALLHAIEASRGRTRDVRWGPRTLDLDLLLHGERVMDDDLRLPHPGIALRPFVLDALCELAPSIRVPGLDQPASALRSRLAAELGAG